MKDISHIFAAMKTEQRLDRLRRHIRKVMKKNQWTQGKVAKAAGLTDLDVSRIMHGVNPRWTTGARIMELDAD